MNRLQPVSDVRERPADDDAHGVVHVGLLHLVFDIDRDVLVRLSMQNPRSAHFYLHKRNMKTFLCQ